MFDINDTLKIKPLGIIGDHITPKQRKVIKAKDPITIRFSDFDRDGVINGLDCQPNNPKEHMTRVLKFKRENTLKKAIPNKPGLYKFYNKSGELLYVGHASRLRHRVQSYNQVDDHVAHPTKRHLRPHIHKFKFQTMPEHKARKLEKRLKPKAKYNYW
jgi:hypothetical protein